MPDAKAIIRISAMPDSQLRRAIAGTVESARRAEKQSAAAQIKAAKEAEREKVRVAKEASKAAERAAAAEMAATKAAAQTKRRAIASVEQAARRAAVEARKEARAQAREAERLAKEEVRWAEWAERLKYQAVQRTSRSAERAAAQQRREANKTARQQVREAQAASTSRRRMAVAVGGAAIGVGVAAAGRAQGFAGAFGARSRDDMAAAAVDFKRRMAILGDTGGLDTSQRADLEARILQESARTGVEAESLLAGLERAQGQFSDLQGFSKVLSQLADVSVAARTDVSSVVGAMGVMRRQMKLTDDEMGQLIGAMVTAAGEGSIELEDFAGSFASALGTLGRNANLQGLQGAIKALALSQVLGMSDKTAPEAATLATNLMSSLSRQTVREAVAVPKSQGGFGVKVSENGKLRDLPTVIRELAEAGFMDPRNTERRNKALPDLQAREALEVLVQQFQSNPEAVNRLLSLSPEQGAADVQRRLGLANEGILGQAATIGTRQFATFVQSGQFERFLELAVTSADGLTQLEAKFPLVAEGADMAAGALKGLAGALLGDRLLGGAGGAAAGAGGAVLGGAVLSGAGAKAATGAALGLGSTVAIAGATGLAAGFGTYGLMRLAGYDPETLGYGMWGALNYEPRRSSTRGVPAGEEPVLYSEARDSDFVSREPVPWTPAPPPGAAPAPPAEATLNIRVHGPAQVTSVSSDGFGEIALMSVDTGRRDVLPP